MHLIGAGDLCDADYPYDAIHDNCLWGGEATEASAQGQGAEEKTGPQIYKRGTHTSKRCSVFKCN